MDLDTDNAIKRLRGNGRRQTIDRFAQKRLQRIGRDTADRVVMRAPESALLQRC